MKKKQMDLKDNFLKKVRFNEDSFCWEWIGSKDWFGYGKMIIELKSYYAHRISYEIFNGKIGDNLVIDHLCKNKSCLNPEHLEATSRAENTRRGTGFAGKNRQKEFCPKGHKLDKENLNSWDLKRGKRGCEECRQIRQKTRTFRNSISVDWVS
jgi:HNH endonuclease